MPGTELSVGFLFSRKWGFKLEKVEISFLSLCQPMPMRRALESELHELVKKQSDRRLRPSGAQKPLCTFMDHLLTHLLLGEGKPLWEGVELARGTYI